MADSLGVTSTDSPSGGNIGTTDVPAASSTAAGVSADSPTDRPEQNWQREFQRKQQESDRKLEAVLQYLVAGAQQTQQPASKGPATDEELWAQAQQGDRVAFEEYQRRIAAKEVNQREQVNRRQAVIRGQLQALVGKYPVLQNPQHPLAQTMNQAYQLLLGNGYAAGEETLLEAAKTAIADRPDLVVEHYTQTSQAREQARQDTTRRAQSGMTGGSNRGPARQASGQFQAQTSPEEQALAARMGVKDPAKAMERFRERQKQGRSAFGAVAAFLPEEDR